MNRALGARAKSRPNPKAAPKAKPKATCLSGAGAASSSGWNRNFETFRIQWSPQKGRIDLVVFKRLVDKRQFFQVSVSQAGSAEQAWAISNSIAEALAAAKIDESGMLAMRQRLCEAK